MKFISHSLPFLLLLFPLAWGIYGYSKTRGEEKTSSITAKRSAWPLIINSAVLYALAFNLIFFIQELFLALGKKWLGLKAWLYHNNHNWEGSHPMDRLAQGYGAVAILLTGLICLFLAYKWKRSPGWLHLFFLWMAFQGFAQSIPQFITAKIAPDTDTGQAFTYLGIGNTAGVVISITGIVSMLYIGASFSEHLLRLAQSMDHVNTARRRFSYLLNGAVLAAVFGVLLIIPFRIMPWDRAAAPVMVTLITIPMVFAHAWKAKVDYTVNSDVNKKIFLVPVIILLLLLLVFQLVLAKGVVL